ncbi:alcohol dehydrogenase [Athelia psychrophila]|uniref:Alcohol dehydrogenase n=1 Tax=Athelia psychrophila TaxID=1759441 RepID=A0A166A0I1_9AGAM|nr:alcohol dehydrogenase [Fibularhizoctonia sp. CBS 109695]
MAPVRNARVIYKSHPSTYLVPGETTQYDASQTIDIDNVPLNGGEFILQSIAVSSDPVIRLRMHAPEFKGFLPPFKIGERMEGFGVGRVIRSANEKYPNGTVLYGVLGFEEYAVRSDIDAFMPWIPMQKPDGLTWSLYVGAIGVPGETAYFGWRALAEEKAKTSKTVFISVAGGPVGTFLIQFIKLKHPELKIIASAGSQQKLDYMKSVGADVVINYKTEDVGAVLAQHGPLDIYWDMTAGPILGAALTNMNRYGLIVACGAISGYSAEQPPPVFNFNEIFQKSLTVRGFHATDFFEEYYAEFMREVPKLIEEGKITVLEQRYIGMENAEEALLSVHTGANFGKAVVILSDDA